MRLPTGWRDYTAKHGPEVEAGANARAPVWPHLTLTGLWLGQSGHTRVVAGTLDRAPAIGLKELGRRTIAMDNRLIPRYRVEREPSLRRVGGSQAALFDYSGASYPDAWRPLRGRVVLIRHAGKTLIVALETDTERFTTAGWLLDDILDSWEWT